MTPRNVPQLDYLTKDYAGFRRQLLDQLALHVPAWREDNPADIGITLVELLAFAADGLSYAQDTASTEAYLGTAQNRRSIRRHARLLDYSMHEGCNARAWVHLQVGGKDALALKKGTPFLTGVEGARQWSHAMTEGGDEARELINAGATVFESMHDARLHQSLNELRLLGSTDGAFLSKGSRRARVEESWDLESAVASTLRGESRRPDSSPHLRPGDYVLLEETEPAPGSFVRRRHVVRLTSVRRPDLGRMLRRSGRSSAERKILGRLLAPRWRASDEFCHGLANEVRLILDGDFQPYVELEWGAADALPFPLSTAPLPPTLLAQGAVLVRWRGETSCWWTTVGPSTRNLYPT